MNERIIKVTLTEHEQRQLTEIARRKNMTHSDAVHEAVKSWIRSYSKFLSDPLFMIKPVDTGIETDSSSLDRKQDHDKI